MFLYAKSVGATDISSLFENIFSRFIFEKFSWVVNNSVIWWQSLNMATNQKIRIKIKSFDHKIIDEVSKNIIQTALDTGAIVAGPIPLPTKIKKFTVIKPTFKYKDSRDQFEIRTHARLIDFRETTPQTIESLQNLQVPAGVDIEIKMMMDKKTTK